MNTHLLIIDPQNDFTDPNGSLYVAGANEDMERLSAMINRLSGRIDDIHVTLDSHRTIDVAHPGYWVNSKGENPAPFTIISEDDVSNGTWVAKCPAFQKKAVEYVKDLSKGGKYPLCVWPEHCIIGSWGHSISPTVSDALRKWENDNFGFINYCVKGDNIHTEHYGAIMAEVSDPEDPKTRENTELLDILETADILAIAGEALSHCVANTVRQIIDIRDDIASKIVILEDASSNVTGFESLGDDFVSDMKAKGVQFTTTTEFLK